MLCCLMGMRGLVFWFVLLVAGPAMAQEPAVLRGRVLDAEGRVARRLFAMGPPLRGMWWESTAVTDVASQAKALAARLAGGKINL